MLTYQLATQNSWWLKKDAMKSDFQIEQFEQSAISWNPRIKYYFQLDSDLVYTLRGPRQVGKTTLIKQIIREILSQEIDPRRIFYWTCDLIESPNELANLIQQYLQYSKQFAKERRFIFLDEISSVREWQKGIKHLWDTGNLKNTTLLLTGSHSLDIRKAAERLPGRRGESETVLDKILMPMKFAEYVETRDPTMRSRLSELGLISFIARKEVLLDLAVGNIPQVIEELNLHSPELSSFLDDYLLTGGIPKAISDYVKEGSIGRDTFSTYVNATIGDIHRWGKKETYLSQILRRVIETMGTHVSWRTLQKETDIGNQNTVQDYIDVLTSSFVLCPIFVIDREKQLPLYGKEKKIIFHDPFIFHALNGWIRQSSSPFNQAMSFLANEGKTRLIESVVGDHLIRLVFNFNPSADFDPTCNLMYWKTTKDEVDYVIKINQTYLPIEVKYTSSFSKSDINGMYTFTRSGNSYKGIVITKNLLNNEKNVMAIPAYLFLLLI
jgi:hypothetical protein